jgi:poly-gamma-glutamate synthesis protein (capsule biosynthesis protein)
MKHDMEKIRNEVDTVIVSLHWGDEFIQKPSPEEIMVARELINVGADLIIGHHPHVLRGIEHYKQGIIVYSLGNFVCDMIWDKHLCESLIFSCTITKEGIGKVELVPIYINNNYQPEIMKENDGKALLSKIYKMSKELEEETLSSFEKKVIQYQKEANEAERLYRRKSHRFFLSRFYKFPMLILIQQLSTYIRNRINDLNNKKVCL